MVYFYSIFQFYNIKEIHILSNGCLEGLHYSEKLYLVLPFIYNLSKLVLEWKNYDVNKYPDEEYLDKLFEKATLDFK